MSFGAFNTLQEVARSFRVSLNVGQFVQVTSHPVSESFASDMRFFLENVDVRVSEASICDFMIAPILKEVWKSYSDTLLMWSHAPLGTEEPLIGTPDYYFSRRSPLGLVPDQPYLLVVEAKKDDFDAGWAQCLAAMLAAQRLNDPRTQMVFGCVSNGQLWTLGKLEQAVFTQEFQKFVVSNLPQLFGALHNIFAQAKEQARASAA